MRFQGLCQVPVKTISHYLHQPYTRLFMHLRIYTSEILCYNHQRKKTDIAMTALTIEEKYLHRINGLLRFFSKQLNAYRCSVHTANWEARTTKVVR